MQVPRAAGTQPEPSFVALLEDDTLDPATDLSSIAVREQHADDSPYASSAYYPNHAFLDSWQQTSDDVYDFEDPRMAQNSWDDVKLEDDCEGSTMAHGSLDSAELEIDDFAARDGGLVDWVSDVGHDGLGDGDSDVRDVGLVDGDSDVGDGGLVDGDVGDAIDWDGFDMKDVDMDEVEAHKLMEDSHAVDNASRPEAGLGAGVGAAVSVEGPGRLPENLAIKWQAAETQVRILLTHCSLHCATLENFWLRLPCIQVYVYMTLLRTCCL